MKKLRKEKVTSLKVNMRNVVCCIIMGLGRDFKTLKKHSDENKWYPGGHMLQSMCECE